MKKIIGLLAFIFSAATAMAQPELPNIANISQNGMSVLTWINPYVSGIKSVTIERSTDSAKNFSSIGKVQDLSKPKQGFIDRNPVLGANYYKVTVLFNNTIDFESNVVMVLVDSSEMASKVSNISSDSLQRMIGSMPTTGSAPVPAYTPNRYVFTNPFNGNINIELNDALVVNYSIIFYDMQDLPVIELPRVNDEIVVLDKRNFQQSGVYKFKLYKNNEEYQKGMVTIY